MRIQLGQLQFVFTISKVEVKPDIEQEAISNPLNAITVAKDNDELGFVLAHIKVFHYNNVEHATNWVLSHRYGGGGDVEKAKSRARARYNALLAKQR